MLPQPSSRAATADEPSANAPSFPPSSGSLAYRLPYELLHSILLYAADPDDCEKAYGGRVRPWDSSEGAAPFALVCRAWRAPAQAVLFSSVALLGARPASRFLRTITSSRPDLVEKVHTLVLGIEPAAEQSRDEAEFDQLGTSQLLVEALERCTSVAHLQIRPLHHSVRKRLHRTVFSRSQPLVSLVLAPRLLATESWSGRLWRSGDVMQTIPTLLNCEVTTLITPSDLPNPLPPCPPMALRRFKLHYNLPPEALQRLLGSCPQLELLDLYFENVSPHDATLEALQCSVRTMRDLRYISNPTSAEQETLSPPPTSTPPSPPLFNLLLPSYVQLRTLRVSSTDISPSCLLALPPRLTRLYIQSFNAFGRFECARLLEVLQALEAEGATQLPGGPALAELIVVDSPDAGWDDDDVDEVARLCMRVGVRFVFRMDFEVDGESVGSRE
ncbi:hypothetical protein JCM1840_007548 [Sporobolomyces johnsonii]